MRKWCWVFLAFEVSNAFSGNYINGGPSQSGTLDLPKYLIWMWYGVDKGIKRRGYFGPKIPNPDERVGYPIDWLPRLGYIGRKGKGL